MFSCLGMSDQCGNFFLTGWRQCSHYLKEKNEMKDFYLSSDPEIALSLCHIHCLQHNVYELCVPGLFAMHSTYTSEYATVH